MKLFKTKYILAGLFATSLMSACKKDEIGYMSDNLYYELNPVVIPKGWEYRGIGVNPDGSTRPLNFKLVHVYDKLTGKNMDDLFLKRYPMVAWKAALNFTIDSTKERILAKMQMVEAYPVNIEPTSGQIYTNYTTDNLPSGQYVFDMEISNIKQTKLFPKFGEFILKDTIPFQDLKAMNGAYSNPLMKQGQESVTKGQGAESYSIDIQRVPSDDFNITLRFLDKHGNAFNPKRGEVLKRPSGTSFLQTFETYTVKPDLFDDKLVYTVFQTPFPNVSAGNGFNVYYRIAADACIYDDPIYNGYHSNPRFIQRLWKRGKYSITIQLKNVTRKPL